MAAVGVVYGDIGTSPLYAIRECFHGKHAIEVTDASVLGVLSLIFWALILVISIKYLSIIMKADNDGEGGILALMELVLPKKKTSKKYGFLMFIGFFGSALLYGDGMLTPSISVTSAIEGLKVATPLFEPYVIPISILILTILFILQKSGSGGVGMIFGPIMFIWFSTLTVLGFLSILQEPSVLQAVNPAHAVYFFTNHGFKSLFILGAVFLVVTGGEALYADLGHFGRTPILMSWYILVLPGLLINYFGQGALLIQDPTAAENPFYHLAPDWAIYPLVALATMATIIASQAIISGVFSLVFQSINLGYLPNLKIIHTSEEEEGQIYIPTVNWILYVACVLIVIGFGSSSNMAAAYGIAISMTMVVTNVLAFRVFNNLWNWNKLWAILLVAFFMIVDLAFLSANLLKFVDGGWFPILIAALIYFLMNTWLQGRKYLSEKVKRATEPIEEFIDEIDLRKIHQVNGTAIYPTSQPDLTPSALLHNFKHNKILHENIIIMHINYRHIPRVKSDERLEIEELKKSFTRVVAHYGFIERVNIKNVLKMMKRRGLEFDEDNFTFFTGRERLLVSENVGMNVWQSKLFRFMAKNSTRVTYQFNLPKEKVFEIGRRVKI